MFVRSSLIASAAALTAAVLAFAKPPGLPADPRVEGKEPPPVAREYHLPDPPTPACAPDPRPADPSSFWAALRRVAPSLFGHTDRY